MYFRDALCWRACPHCRRSLPGVHSLLELQAYERQLEAANRAMRRGGEAADGLDRERQALLEQLRAAEQVRLPAWHNCTVAAEHCCGVPVW